MTAKAWFIERRTVYGDYVRLAPTLDGLPHIFFRRKDAERYAYESGHMGGRNQVVRYVKGAAPPKPYVVTKY